MGKRVSLPPEPWSPEPARMRTKPAAPLGFVGRLRRSQGRSLNSRRARRWVDPVKPIPTAPKLSLGGREISVSEVEEAAREGCLIRRRNV
jgi:hypothetical protein